MKFYFNHLVPVIIAFLIINGCAHSPMKFQLATGTNQNDYQSAVKDCGGGDADGGYFLFGPLILLAPAVGIIEGVKSHNRGKLQDCMEARGFKCIENCHHQSTITPKPISPELLAKWTELIKTEKIKEWVFYADDPKGTLFYYNPPSLSVVDKRYIYYREQIKFSPDRTDINFGYVWRSVKVNCADKLFNLTDFLAVDKEGKTKDPETVDTGWKSLSDSSQLGKFAYKMCKEKDSR